VDPAFASLPDGRRLAYDEFGDPDGIPVLNCHGGLTSRKDMERCAATAAAAGVRVISSDRPGIGRSDEKPGRTLLDWPPDVVALADALGIERFGVVGWSAGGPYAAACAFALPARVTATALVASGIPGDWPGMMHEINRMDRVLTRLSDRVPTAGTLVFRTIGFMARRAPAVFRRLSVPSLDKPSRRVVAAGTARQFSEPIAEGLRHPAGVLDDYRILASPWGFDPAAIEGRVTVWQGDSDSLVPPAWGDRLAARIPGAELRVCPGEGHFLPPRVYEDIFATMISSAGA
jgi:pimeloyl-ACP methyl ester carboxylesterase